MGRFPSEKRAKAEEGEPLHSNVRECEEGETAALKIPPRGPLGGPASQRDRKQSLRNAAGLMEAAPPLQLRKR